MNYYITAREIMHKNLGYFDFKKAWNAEIIG